MIVGQANEYALSITFVLVTAVVTLFEAVAVTKKGQVTLPNRLRNKYGIKDKVSVEECEHGIMLKPLPSPDTDFGSLKSVSEGKIAQQYAKIITFGFIILAH